MATAKPQRAGPRRHRLRNGLMAIALLAGASAAVFWHHLRAQALLATAYGARVACTCHYIEGRNLQDCRKDFEPGMALVRLSDNVPRHSITARIPLVASETAELHEGAGCQLQSWAP